MGLQPSAMREKCTTSPTVVSSSQDPSPRGPKGNRTCITSIMHTLEGIADHQAHRTSSPSLSAGSEDRHLQAPTPSLQCLPR